MSSKVKSLPQPCAADPLDRNSIVNSVLLPAFSVPCINFQLFKPAPQTEFGITPVSVVAITVPSLATNRTRILGNKALPKVG